FLVLALLPAVCEELAFRGFILQGLLRGFRPWTAILLSAFLFAVYQMNVFQLLPHFVFGVVLGLLAVRSGSVWPAMLFHLLYHCLVLTAAVLAKPEAEEIELYRLAFSGVCAVVAGLGLWAFWRYAPRTLGEGASVQE